MLKISQKTLAEQLAGEYGIEVGKSVPLLVGTNLADFDKNEAPGDWPSRELVSLGLPGYQPRLGQTSPMP